MEYNKFIAGDKKAYITQERIDMLTAIGFVWNRSGSLWMDSYEELKQFYHENGHCHVPFAGSNAIKENPLRRWVVKQRKKYKNYLIGKKPFLTDEQVKLLGEISFFESSNSSKIRSMKASLEPNGSEASRSKKMESVSLGKKKQKGRPINETLIPLEAQQALGMKTAESLDEDQHPREVTELSIWEEFKGGILLGEPNTYRTAPHESQDLDGSIS